VFNLRAYLFIHWRWYRRKVLWKLNQKIEERW